MKIISIFFILISSLSFGQKKSYVPKMNPIRITEVKQIVEVDSLQSYTEYNVETIARPLVCIYYDVAISRDKHDERDYNSASQRTFTRDEIERMPKGSNVLDVIW